MLGQRRGYRLIAVYSEGLEAELKAMVPAECKEEGLSFDYVIEVGEGEEGREGGNGWRGVEGEGVSAERPYV